MSAQLTVVKRKPGYSKWLRVLMYSFLTTLALAWLVPISGALYASFRPYQETQTKGIFSWPDSLTVSNYRDAFTQGDMKKTFLNTAFIVLPAILLITSSKTRGIRLDHARGSSWASRRARGERSCLARNRRSSGLPVFSSTKIAGRRAGRRV